MGVRALPFTFASHVLAAAAAVMVLVWNIHFRGGLAFVSTNKNLIFNVRFLRFLFFFLCFIVCCVLFLFLGIFMRDVLSDAFNSSSLFLFWLEGDIIGVFF